jgi:hypothetical protein
MKNIFKFCTPTLLIFAMVVQSSAATTPANLVAGVDFARAGNTWTGYSAVNLISGTSLLPVTSTQTVLYIGFTNGTMVDISNMVLYTTTAIADSTVAAVTPVKLNGVSNPSIDLTNPSICPAQPVSVANPCVVRLDPIALSLSVSVDYYFVMYLPNDGNNASVASTVSQFSISTLTGGYDASDDTHLAVGQSVPSVNQGLAFFLMSVMNI